jgi:hypothetical protein
VTFLMPLAEVGAVCANLGPPAAVGADSQADAAFFFSPCINWEFTSFCLPLGIGVLVWLKGQPSLHVPNSAKFEQLPCELTNKSLRGCPSALRTL